MKSLWRTMLALLTAFTLMGLVACDDGAVENGGAEGNGAEMEEPLGE